MCRQLPDGAEVDLLHPLGGSGELQILVHALAKRGADEWSFPNEGGKPAWKLILPGSGLLKPNGCPIWLHYTGGNRGRYSST